MKKIYTTSLIILTLFLFSTIASADNFSFSYSTGQEQSSSPAAPESTQNGPPDHAPAHGYRANHMYQYYPSASVYRDTSSGMYFYLSGSNWQVGATLPDSLKVNLGNSVTLEMDTDKPYIYNDQHKQQYPPGQTQKKNKSNKNNKKK